MFCFHLIYRCECPKGYKLDRSGKKCVDDNECLSMSNICGNGTCSNLNGSFECNCAEGYAPGPRGNCEDVDECTEYGHQCAFRCHNTPGSFRCVCPFGYEVAADGRHCIGMYKRKLPLKNRISSHFCYSQCWIEYYPDLCFFSYRYQWVRFSSQYL